MSEPLAVKLVSDNMIFPKWPNNVQPVTQGDANPEGVTVGQLNDFGGEVGARSARKISRTNMLDVLASQPTNAYSQDSLS